MSKPACIFGEVLFDCFPDGQAVLGGAPFNVAWHLQAFGQQPLFVSRVGADDSGARIQRAMDEWGIATAALQTDPEHPTGRVDITLQAGEPQYAIVADCAYDFIDAEALPVGAAGLIYHGSLALRGEVSRVALRRLRDRHADALTFIDVNLRPPWWQASVVHQLLGGADWVKLNRDELALLGDGAVAAGSELAAAERFRAAYGLHGLLLTLGDEGAVALTADQAPVSVKPTATAPVVDAVGAGDAFASVMILGLRLGWTLSTTLDRAQEFASELVQRRGATVADRSFYAGFASQWGLSAPQPGR